MTRRPPLRRRTALALALAGAALVGCSPAPTPTPSATPVFASEEEAFAAAEATYRAYVDALNAVELSDPKTFEAVYDIGSGTVQRRDRTNFSTMHSDRLTLSGAVEITHFHGESFDPSTSSIAALSCLDVSSIEIADAAGNSTVNPARPDIYSTRVTLVGTAEAMTVNKIEQVENPECTA